MGLKTNPSCGVSGVLRESMIHVLQECPNKRAMWGFLEKQGKKHLAPDAYCNTWVEANVKGSHNGAD